MSISDFIKKAEKEKDNIIKTKVEVDDTWIEVKKEEEAKEANLNIENDR